VSFVRGQELALTGARCRVSSPHPPHPIESDSNIDKASQALAESLPDSIPDTLTAQAAHSNVPLSTVTHRANGRPSLESKAVGQQYLYPYEEDAVANFVLQSSALSFPIRMKYLPAIAFSATRHQPKADRPLKPPHINWVKPFKRRRPEIVRKKNRPQD
jgi:hypothetical protein